jgi:hypothetical protein
MHIKFWSSENLKVRDHLEDLGMDHIKMDLKEIEWKDMN